MDAVFMIAALWMSGGVVFMHGALNNPHASSDVAETSRDLLDRLIRREPSALTALALFIAVWPALFVCAHLRKMKRRR